MYSSNKTLVYSIYFYETLQLESTEEPNVVVDVNFSKLSMQTLDK